VVLGLLERLRRKPLTDYERDVLRQEYARLARRLEQREGMLGTVRCSRCVYEEDPRAVRLLPEIRALRRTMQGIERRLGEVPDVRRSRRPA